MAVSTIGGVDISSTINQFVQNIESQVVSAAVNTAVDTLRQVVSSYDAGIATQAASQVAQPASGLPYVNSLVGKYLGMGLGFGGGVNAGGALQNLEKVLSDLVAKLTARPLDPAAPAAGTVTPPAIAGRDIQAELKQIIDQLVKLLQTPAGGAAPATSPAPAAPAAAAPAAPAAPAAAAPAAGGSLNDIANQALASNTGEFNADESAMLDNIKDPKQKAMMTAQLRLQHAQEILTFITNFLKKKNEMAMSIAQNLK
jgi:hypothetical protein